MINVQRPGECNLEVVSVIYHVTPFLTNKHNLTMDTEN